MGNWLERKGDGSLDVTEEVGTWILGTAAGCFVFGPFALAPLATVATFKALGCVGRGIGRTVKEAKKYATKPKETKPAKVVQVPQQSTELAIRNVDDEIRALDEILARKLAYWESAENVGERERRHEINKARQQHAVQIERLIN